MSNKERILQMAAELKAASDRYKAAKDAAIQARKDGETFWRMLRPTLLETEKLGGFKEAGYKTWKEFCQKEFGKRAQSTYSEELTIGYFEELIFQVPLCTYTHNFFVKSGCYPGFRIRRVRGNGWEFVPEEIEKAKIAWEIAKKLADENNRSLPDRNDMGNAIAKMAGVQYEPQLYPLEKANCTIKALKEELDKASERILSLEEEIADLKEAKIVSDLKEFKRQQFDVCQMIYLHCPNPIQQKTAMEILLGQGVEEAKKHLFTFIANKHRRQAA